MSTTGIERPIELVPAVHRALLAQRVGVLRLPMRPQPVLTDAQWGRLVSGLIELGHLYEFGDRGAGLLNAAWQEGAAGQPALPVGPGW